MGIVIFWQILFRFEKFEISEATLSRGQIIQCAQTVLESRDVDRNFSYVSGKVRFQLDLYCLQNDELSIYSIGKV